MATLNPGAEPYSDSLMSYLDEWVRDVGPQKLLSFSGTTNQVRKGNDELAKEDIRQPATPRKSQGNTVSMVSTAKPGPTKAAYSALAPSDKDTTVIIDLCEESSDQEMEQTAIAPNVKHLPGAQTNVKGRSTYSTHPTSKFNSLRAMIEISATRQVSNDVPPASNIGVAIKHEKIVPEAALGKQAEDSVESWGLPATMPLQLLDQVHEWNDHNPGRNPSFAAMYNPNTPLHETPASVKTSFWHISGKKLEVGWYDLPERLYPQSTNHGGYLRLLVAYHGPCGPCFFRYASASTPSWSKVRGKAYKAWIGFDGLNKNGFEFEPSIFKITNTSNRDENAACSLSTNTSGDTFEPLHKASKSEIKLPQPDIELVSCPSTMHHQPESSAHVEDGSESANALLQSFMMPVVVNDKQKATPKIDKQPSHLLSSSRPKEKVKRRASPDEALEPPKKIPRPDTPLSTNASEEMYPWSLRRLLRLPLGYSLSTNPRDGSGNPRPAVRLTIKPPKLCELPSNIEQPRKTVYRSPAIGGEQSKPCVPTIEEVTQQQGLEEYGMTSAVAGGQSEFPKRSCLNAETTRDYTEIDAHMRENTVVLFYADPSHSPRPTPRPRMISACNTSNKLFAQASAGSVFPSSHIAGKTRVLSLRFNNQAELIPVVEEDEEDFEAFIMTLRQASCWSTDLAGKMTGICTVEVRAKA